VVDLRVDHDVIDARGEGSFRAIRIEVEHADLEMYDSVVRFGNGESFSPTVRHHFQEGSWSRVIDLPGNLRPIKRIDFWYKTSRLGEGRARVVVGGLR
jgi:hypothetical protein